VGGRSRARPGRFDVAFVDAFDALGDLGVVTVGTPRPARRAPCLCSVRVACLSAARRCADARGVEAHGGVGSGTGPGVTEMDASCIYVPELVALGCDLCITVLAFSCM
jgi:hypothetical protein